MNHIILIPKPEKAIIRKEQDFYTESYETVIREIIEA